MFDLSIPQRQSKKVILVYLLKNIRGLILLILYALFGMRAWSNLYISIGFMAFFGFVSLISPVLQYLFFTFQIEDDELIINKGWLFKERKAIPLERVQSINIDENVVQRLLNIVAVEIETAGSKKKELEIPGLEREVAYELKKALAQDKSLGKEMNYEEEHPQQHTTVEDTSTNVVLQLSLLDLLKVGITQNHLRSGGLALGVLLGFWYNIKDAVEQYFGNPFENWDEDLEQYVTTHAYDYSDIIITGIVGLLFFLVVSILISLLTTINQFYGFSLIKEKDYLELKMGLLNRREIKIPLSKVQILEFHSNPLRKLLGYQTARIFQAQSQDDKLSAVSVPACKPDMIEKLQELVFNETATATDQVHAFKWSYVRLTFYITIAIIGPMIALAVYFEFYQAIILLCLSLLIILGLSYKYGANCSIASDATFMIFKKGWVFPRTIITPIYKAQAVEKWRSIFIKRRSQAHLKMHTASGSRQVKYLPELLINSINNQINNQVIQSTKNWM